jgi:hypothetical protein
MKNIRYILAFLFLLFLCSALFITEKNKKQTHKTELNERN